MSSEDDSQDKPHDPTQKRLDDARAKGQIPRSQDVLSAAALAGFLIAAAVFGPAALQGSATAGMILLEQAGRPGASVKSGSWAMLVPVLPLVLVPALMVILVLAAQRALLFTPDNLMPKLSRIDPIAAAGQRFGADGLVDFAKGGAKMALVGGCLGLFLWNEADVLLATIALDPAQGVSLMLGLLLRFLGVVLALSLLLAAADYFWQILRHRARNRMSHQEMIEEFRESEGDPQTKAQRRQRGQDIAMNRMLADVPRADVVIVNPTHYAVALKWHRDRKEPPICVAKGVDEVALRIRALAAESGVPIRRDPPTARAIHATVEVGQHIRPDHYRAVAAAIRFAEALRRKARGL